MVNVKCHLMVCGLIGFSLASILFDMSILYCFYLFYVKKIFFVLLYLYVPYIHIIEKHEDFVDSTGYGDLGDLAVCVLD